MKLRDRLSTNKGMFSNWPPIWTHTREDPTDKPQGETDKPQGEIGNLQEVILTAAADDVLFIAIEYEDRRYMGALLLSPEFCRQIYFLLQSHIGLSIEKIGDLDLP